MMMESFRESGAVKQPRKHVRVIDMSNNYARFAAPDSQLTAHGAQDY